jgi:hypothetical protein
MKTAVLLSEHTDVPIQIDMDIDPKKNEVYDILGGRATFIGQLLNTDIVVIKAVNGKGRNKHILPFPFNEEVVYGSILLVRMDANANHQDLTVEEYMTLHQGSPDHTLPSS